MPSRKLKVGLALLVVYLVWGSTYFVLKYAVVSLPPFLLVGVRNLMAGSVLAVVAWPRLRQGFERRHLVGGVGMGLMLIAAGNGSVTFAQHAHVPSGVAALVVGLIPTWMALFSLAAARPGRRELALKGVGLLLGLSGLYALVSGGALAARGGSTLTTALLVLGTLTWGFGSVFGRTWPSHPDLLAGTALTMLAGGLGATAIGTVLGEWRALDLGAVTAQSGAAFAYLVVIGSVVAFSAYAWLLKNADPALVGTYAYVNPLVALALGHAFAGEELTTPVMTAAGLIVVSVVAMTAATAVSHKSRTCGELATVLVRKV